jgi:quaternary ammonium compound-resistance protein SugE
LAAGLFEIGWPIGLKQGYTDQGLHWGWIAFGCICIGVSGTLLLYPQQNIPNGTAHAVWTGIGAVGTFIVGVIIYGDSASALRMVCVLLIIVGVIGLKLA